MFNEKLPELEVLPKKPTVFWYPSAGSDFRGPVTFTSYKISHELKHHSRVYSKPDIFIYNSLGEEVLELKEKFLEGGNVVLFQDYSTTVTAKNFKTINLNTNFNFEINTEFIDIENLPINGFHLNEVFYFELEICGEDYNETQKILYFQSENIDFYKKVILKNIFNTQYLCATKEGLAWGRCYKSIIEYVFAENQYENFIELGFKPKYFILSVDVTKDIFDNYLETSKIISAKKYGKYISRLEFEEETIIYKAKYLKSQIEANLAVNHYF